MYRTKMETFQIFKSPYQFQYIYGIELIDQKSVAASDQSAVRPNFHLRIKSFYTIKNIQCSVVLLLLATMTR